MYKLYTKICLMRMPYTNTASEWASEWVSTEQIPFRGHFLYKGFKLCGMCGCEMSMWLGIPSNKAMQHDSMESNASAKFIASTVTPYITIHHILQITSPIFAATTLFIRSLAILQTLRVSSIALSDSILILFWCNLFNEPENETIQFAIFHFDQIEMRSMSMYCKLTSDKSDFWITKRITFILNLKWLDLFLLLIFAEYEFLW